MSNRLWATTALIVVVLGVLPFLWHTSVVWQVLGLAGAVAVATHTARRALTGR